MIKKILAQYNIPGEYTGFEENNSGNINKTMVATFVNEGRIEKYLVQKINTNVFPEPYKLMANIKGVTTHLKKEARKQGDTTHKTLDIVETKKREPLCRIDNSFFRIYDYIEDAIAYDCSKDPDIVFNTGRAFGNFQRLLANYPMHKLEETIPDFHNTPKRLQSLMEDIKVDSKGRVMSVAKEIVFILQKADLCSLITSQLGTEEVPLRVTHNDTKVNNVLMNMLTGDFLAVIDLDTVMPGSLLYDYADGVRSTCSTAKEDEKDLSKVSLDLELFKKYTDGFMSEMADSMTETEVNLMAQSIIVITLELAIRFLNDYINGDTYFKIDYETHNLDRARNQIALVKDMESKLDLMDEYIQESYRKYKNCSTRKRTKNDN